PATLVWVQGPRSSGDRAPPSGGGSAGSNPAGGTTTDQPPQAPEQAKHGDHHSRPIRSRPAESGPGRLSVPNTCPSLVPAPSPWPNAACTRRRSVSWPPSRLQLAPVTAAPAV